MIDQTELANRFIYHPPKDGQADRYIAIREEAHRLAAKLNKWVPDSREKSLAMTHLEDAVMWANAAIARNE
jgi:hypothetical protein